MKISKEKLLKMIREEISDLEKEQDTVDDLVYELEHILGRKPTEEETEKIRKAVAAKEIPLRGSE